MGGWFVSSLAPTGGLRHTSYDTAIYSNFWSFAAQEAGAPSPSGVWSHGGSMDVASQLTVGGKKVLTEVVSTGPTKTLLQRVYLTDTTCRVSVTNVFSTYSVASMTPVSSQSQILIRASLYGVLLTNATVVQLASHLVRNPTAANSLVLLTGSESILNGIEGEAVGTSLSINIPFTVTFEAVDSATNLNPKQYGVDWARIAGGGGLIAGGGHVTLEEWL